MITYSRRDQSGFLQSRIADIVLPLLYRDNCGHCNIDITVVAEWVELGGQADYLVEERQGKVLPVYWTG